MDIGIICFTMNGFLLAEQAKEVVEEEGHSAAIFTKSRYLKEETAQEVKGSLKQWAMQMFETMDGILFIGASGIAIRAIAPWVEDKKDDPAVMVMDERGSYCISLLSGHIGGANELTEMIARGCGATPVITTGTDVNGLFAVDVFARKNNLYITNMDLAKDVAARLIKGEPVGFSCEVPYEGELPSRLLEDAALPLGIHVGIHYHHQPFEQTLWLIPKVVTAGIGCRQGTDRETIEDLFEEGCQINCIFHEAIREVATIDLKKDEKGLLEFCREADLPITVFTADELKEAEGEFTPSAFVHEITGVDNVCERSALLSSKKGHIIQKKMADDGVTVAFALDDWSVEF